MKIILSPIRSDDTLTLSKVGDIVTINGQELDLSGIPEGAIVPSTAVDSPWVCGPISRTGGELTLTVMFPHGMIPWPAPASSRVVTYPEPLTVTEDGPIALPTWSAEEEPIDE